MSAYQLNKLCHRTLNDLAFREAMQRQPETAIADFDLTAAEREALLAGDVARLFEMGVHPFLLSFLTRYELFGLTAAVYSERIRSARDPYRRA
jgi:Aromatic-ring-opening dioxygenase LigAB, LigA subunit